MPSFWGEPLRYWRELPWWPEGQAADVQLGPPGHDREIVVSFAGYYTSEEGNHVPDLVVEMFTQLLPDSWKVESRGSRIEVHPSGHFAGGFHADDTPTVLRALTEVGFKPTVTYPTP